MGENQTERALFNQLNNWLDSNTDDLDELVSIIEKLDGIWTQDFLNLEPMIALDDFNPFAEHRIAKNADSPVLIKLINKISTLNLQEQNQDHTKILIFNGLATFALKRQKLFEKKEAQEISDESDQDLKALIEEGINRILEIFSLQNIEPLEKDYLAKFLYEQDKTKINEQKLIDKLTDYLEKNKSNISIRNESRLKDLQFHIQSVMRTIQKPDHKFSFILELQSETDQNLIQNKSSNKNMLFYWAVDRDKLIKDNLYPVDALIKDLFEQFNNISRDDASSMDDERKLKIALLCTHIYDFIIYEYKNKSLSETFFLTHLIEIISSMPTNDFNQLKTSLNESNIKSNNSGTHKHDPHAGLNEAAEFIDTDSDAEIFKLILKAFSIVETNKSVLNMDKFSQTENITNSEEMLVVTLVLNRRKLKRKLENIINKKFTEEKGKSLIEKLMDIYSIDPTEENIEKLLREVTNKINSIEGNSDQNDLLSSIIDGFSNGDKELNAKAKKRVQYVIFNEITSDVLSEYESGSKKEKVKQDILLSLSEIELMEPRWLFSEEQINKVKENIKTCLNKDGFKKALFSHLTTLESSFNGCYKNNQDYESFQITSDHDVKHLLNFIINDDSKKLNYSQKDISDCSIITVDSLSIENISFPFKSNESGFSFRKEADNIIVTINGAPIFRKVFKFIIESYSKQKDNVDNAFLKKWQNQVCLAYKALPYKLQQVTSIDELDSIQDDKLTPLKTLLALTNVGLDKVKNHIDQIISGRKTDTSFDKLEAPVKDYILREAFNLNINSIIEGYSPDIKSTCRKVFENFFSYQKTSLYSHIDKLKNIITQCVQYDAIDENELTHRLMHLMHDTEVDSLRKKNHPALTLEPHITFKESTLDYTQYFIARFLDTEKIKVDYRSNTCHKISASHSIYYFDIRTFSIDGTNYPYNGQISFEVADENITKICISGNEQFKNFIFYNWLKFSNAPILTELEKQFNTEQLKIIASIQKFIPNIINKKYEQLFNARNKNPLSFNSSDLDSISKNLEQIAFTCDKESIKSKLPDAKELLLLLENWNNNNIEYLTAYLSEVMKKLSNDNHPKSLAPVISKIKQMKDKHPDAAKALFIDTGMLIFKFSRIEQKKEINVKSPNGEFFNEYIKYKDKYQNIAPAKRWAHRLLVTAATIIGGGLGFVLGGGFGAVPGAIIGGGFAYYMTQPLLNQSKQQCALDFADTLTRRSPWPKR